MLIEALLESYETFPICCNVNDSAWCGDITKIDLKNLVFSLTINKQIRQLDIDQLEHSIRQFIEIEFDYLLGFQEYINYMKLEEWLKTLILWDRYNKWEPIIEGLQFEIVRNVLNKFNTRNLIEFLSDKSYALLFVNYFEKASENDCLNQREIDPERLKQEMKTLYDEADKYVQISLDHFKGFFRPLSPIFPYMNQYEYSFE